MNLKFVLFVFLAIGATSEAKTFEKPVLPVDVPDDCASVTFDSKVSYLHFNSKFDQFIRQACPPSPSAQQLCAKNTVTDQLGTFDSECNFGRYNNCYRTTQSKSQTQSTILFTDKLFSSSRIRIS